MLDDMPAPATTSRDYDLVRKAIRFLSEAWTEQPDLDRLAAHLGLGPTHVQKLFKRTGLSFEKMDLVELNEAFACQVLSVLKGWGWNDEARLNVNGSGISLGHPIAATGVRILATMLNEMQRRGVRYGLETMCVGGGQGVAAIFERA